ncbi:MAG: UDP-N-acetylmuramoyl-L-alanyl-D-glutamate--2,6-diaminopimelate ligase, partial [Candidatus Cloacimonadaceae bacterium]|nr:UDP-N-acetylmuramoyl-L-alanyl-D-glutamate--2,6-diaminopimelate ligase [Candidatus Cloacimonadaceae bacterium]
MKIGDLIKILQEHGLFIESKGIDDLTRIEGAPITDNRLLSKGDIFICIKGFSHDGHDFIEAASAKGASLIIRETESNDELPSIRVSDSRKAAALAAKLYYRNPVSNFRLVGITGTNGKTTTSIILFKALRSMGIKAGLIGTLGYQINDEIYKTDHTTPDSIELNSIFARMAKAELSYVIMEVSSHALALDRVYGVEFDYCLFSNLSRDHLDFHANMEEYGAAKFKLFDTSKRKQAVSLINIDDPFGKTIHTRLIQAGAYSFSLGHADANFVVKDVETGFERSSFSLQTREGEINIESRLLGNFNVNNLALAAATLSLMGFETKQISASIKDIEPVRGRFELIPNDRGIGIFIDYAHTPDAIENVLKTCRDLANRRILTLIGAGGDRDKGKRPLMLQTALKNSDAVIISDDNPRGENPDAIILDITSGAHACLPWWIVRDRREAIRSILRLSNPGDIVLICGKGHETYQEIEGVKQVFDDHEVVRAILSQSDETLMEDDDKLVIPIDGLMLDILCGNMSIENPRGYKEPKLYHYLSTDSRTIRSGSVFFAVKGERFDGHHFIGNVLKDPANLVVREQRMENHQFSMLNSQSSILDSQFSIKWTDSTMNCLAALCQKYLLMFDPYKIAITGSTGKTSCKEFVGQILGSHKPTLKNLANENNLMGLCNTIRRIKPEHNYAVFEIGTNHFGEIKVMADIILPDCGIIVNIGPSHLETLIDEDGVYREKTALFERPLDLRLFDADDPRFAEYKAKGKGVGYCEDADFRITDIERAEESISFKLNGSDFSLSYPFPHFIGNAAYAIALGMHHHIPVEKMRKALGQPLNLGLRMAVEHIGESILIADCYNANPLSMQKAIEFWRFLHPEKPHLAILGDMLELG